MLRQSRQRRAHQLITRGAMDLSRVREAGGELGKAVFCFGAGEGAFPKDVSFFGAAKCAVRIKRFVAKDFEEPIQELRARLKLASLKLPRRIQHGLLNQV